jgi:flavin-dependent thymidylate synthase
MKVTLISHTQSAEDLLIFTKSTRLEMKPDLLDKVKEMSHAEKSDQLEYMANTIPSSWEFVDYVFLVEGVSRAYTHQQVRTRQASYAQQTMRVLEMGDFDYVYSERILKDAYAKNVVDAALASIKQAYNSLLTIGIPAEDARGILPTNIATNIVCKFNLRTFVDLAKSRTGGRTQNEYQQVINGMVDAVLRVHPWADKFLFSHGRDHFNDIEEYAKAKFPDLRERGELLKIVDKMRKEGK